MTAHLSPKRIPRDSHGIGPDPGVSLLYPWRMYLSLSTPGPGDMYCLYGPNGAMSTAVMWPQYPLLEQGSTTPTEQPPICTIFSILPTCPKKWIVRRVALVSKIWVSFCLLRLGQCLVTADSMLGLARCSEEHANNITQRRTRRKVKSPRSKVSNQSKRILCAGTLFLLHRQAINPSIQLIVYMEVQEGTTTLNLWQSCQWSPCFFLSGFDPRDLCYAHTH